MAETTRTGHRFYVKENASGQPRLVSELLKGEEPGGSGFVRLDPAPGTTMQQAEDLARIMNRQIVRASFTRSRIRLGITPVVTPREGVFTVKIPCSEVFPHGAEKPF
jgi:hypothetical protein